MRYLRTSIVVLLIGILLTMGYLRERYLLVFDSHTVFGLIKKYPRIAATNFTTEITNILGFKLSPKLTSSILFSLIFTLIVSLIVDLLISEKTFTRLIVILYFFYMIICFLLILLGNIGLDYHLSYGLSHYIEDLFLSPFILMFLIPVMLFKRNNPEQ